MSIDRFNAEGYYDPTCYEAMKSVARADRQSAFLPMVYICSPYSGDVECNVMKARKYSRFAYEQKTIPMTPHLLYPQFMNDSDPTEREDAMHFNYVLLGKCNELWVFGDVISKGMEHEIGIARKRKQKIRWFSEDCKEAEQHE